MKELDFFTQVFPHWAISYGYLGECGFLLFIFVLGFGLRHLLDYKLVKKGK